MPKNKGKGGKNRRRGKNENESEKRELVFKEDGQEYAQVIKMLGNGRLEAMCFDGVKRLCHIRGKLRKKVWINTSDIILVGLRDYQDNKADVILKYNADEARSLKAYGELPEHAKINETDTFGPGDDDEIQFDDIGDDDEDIDDVSGHILLFLLSVQNRGPERFNTDTSCFNEGTDFILPDCHLTMQDEGGVDAGELGDRRHDVDCWHGVSRQMK
ncbi:eukaryotic translation initiation factor 1A, X-chromosomal [Mus pahari]|nr:eukaryotic translation initiation factor 1A, X-chromosomal [Mus pahari]